MAQKTKKQKITEVKKWCQQSIQKFRLEYDSLNDLQKTCIQNHLSLLAPCQIEIFWVSDPVEYQLVLIFHDPDREDQEVIINGPYLGYELEHEVIQIMEEPRWKKKVRYQFSEVDEKFEEFEFDMGNQERKYSDYFVPVFSYFLNTLRNDPLINTKEGTYSGALLGNEEDPYRIIKGNLASLNQPDLLFLDYIEYARQDAKRKKEIPNTDEVYLQNDKNKKLLRFAGAYYYPGVYIGDSFELSFKEKLYGPNILDYPRFEHEFSFGKRKGYFDKYGLVLLQCNTEEDVIRKINLFFAISLLKGIPVLSIRSPE